MSEERFKHLEFEAPTARVSAGPQATRDEQHYLAEARTAYLEGDYEQALRLYSEALKHDKALHEAWAAQIRCLVHLQELREAKAWSEKACNLFPGIALLDSARARALAACGIVPDALAASDAALEQGEKTGMADPHLWLERAATLLANRQVPTAEHCFGKALEMVGGDVDWVQRVAVEWLEGGEPARALALLNTVVEQRPQRGYAWLLRGQALRRLGQRKSAEESLARAESLWPDRKVVAEERRLLKRSCWIATLVFGHERAPAVVTLREWRESAWMPRRTGRLLSGFYDQSAPALCRLLARWPGGRRTARAVLTIVADRLQSRKERAHGQKARA